MKNLPEGQPRAALFVTCLVDLMRPSVGFAAARLIEAAGFELVVPEGQTCCGQPNYNSGDRQGARRIARATIDCLDDFDTVVVPSGSCAAMLVHHYPALFEAGDPYGQKAAALAGRTSELVTFLAQHGYVPQQSIDSVVTYHDSCSGLRELNIKQAPRDLLSRIAGLDLKEMGEPEVCCGFGGTFCVKYPDVSGRMVENKTADIEATGADMVAMGDVGCLMNIEGRLHREGRAAQGRHIAEVLADALGQRDAD
ncbi:MAG: (Fe-S)-binding protein [Alphaproteobacteria bacterium]